VRKDHHDDLTSTLISRDPGRVADYLRNMHMHKATFGVSGDVNDHTRMNSRLERSKRGAVIKDILVSLAEALAILPYETLVPYVAKKNIYEDADALVDKIGRKLGIRIAPPEIDGGLYKMALKDVSFDERDLWSLYAAWRIKINARPGSAIAEIGAGMGKVARYTSLFGFEDYSIFDLPFMNVIQGWYLLKTMGEKNVRLYGEQAEESAIKVLPYWKLGETEKSYGLVLNQDSFPEIHRDIVSGYLEIIRDRADHFLSINHEHQAPLYGGSDEKHLLVPQITAGMPALTKKYRFPFWLRQGYVEELYETARS
jgi:putative sugar O-methyltransferase